MPKSTVSREVAELEEGVGARLLQRTTRKLSLSDVGRT
jgi:DNA-binding transcriptional LysR family regulator